MIFSCTLLEIPLPFRLTSGISTFPFLNTPGNSMSWAALFLIFSEIVHFGEFWPKNTTKQPKMAVSAGTKAFENLKLENYRSEINKTCLVCLPS